MCVRLDCQEWQRVAWFCDTLTLSVPLAFVNNKSQKKFRLIVYVLGGLPLGGR
jgi:hypothetical protein